MCNKDISQAVISDKYLRSFGRVKGRVLRPSQLKVIEDILPQVQILLDEFEGEYVDLAKVFSEEAKEINLEIGFGGGEFLKKQAIDNPSSSYIGCEPFINGIANFFVLLKMMCLVTLRFFMVMLEYS